MVIAERKLQTKFHTGAHSGPDLPQLSPNFPKKKDKKSFLLEVKIVVYMSA